MGPPDAPVCLVTNFADSLKLFCATAIKKSFSVENSDLSNPLWLEPPKNGAESMLREYAALRLENPGASACLLLSKKASKAQGVRPLLKGMTIIAENRSQAEFATVAGVVKAPWPYIVYYDRPRPAISLSQAILNPGLTMQLDCVCSGTTARALIDTGASHSFVSETFIRASGVTLPQGGSPPPEVLLASGVTTGSLGTVTLRVQFKGGFVDRLPCVVLKETLGGVDLILGNTWLNCHRAIINFDNYTCIINTPTRKIVLKSFTAKPARTPAQPIGSWAQLKRCLRSGDEIYCGLTTEIASEPPSLGKPEDVDPPGEHLKTLLEEFEDVFPETLPGLPPDRNIFHTIPMHDHHSPPFKPLYRLARPELEECKRQVAELLNVGAIRPSASPYGSPILFVKKKDGTMRMVVDYRAVNKLTRQDRYPLPRIDDILDKLQGARYFSSLDLLSGYHQIKLKPEDVEKTAFRTPFGLYEFLVLPFGLTNAPATFQRVMNHIFRDFVAAGFVVIYLDDVLVYSKSSAEHEHHLRMVLSRLRQAQLYAKLAKCSFFKDELAYLGHIVGRHGLKVDPSKVTTVANWPIPTNVHELRSFLGLANYFRKFVANYSALTAPLTGLTGKKTTWVWNPDHLHSFEEVKKALISAPVLALPDLEKPFVVVADASRFGTGAVLLQEDRPVAYYSHKMNSAESNYHTTEQELLGVVLALREWRCYLLGSPFTVITDHKANTYFDTQGRLSARQARWAEFLKDFHINWRWEPGSTNIADPISRCPTLAVTTRRTLRGALAPHLPQPMADCPPLEGAMGAAGSADSDPPPNTFVGTQDFLESLLVGYPLDAWLAKRANRRKVTLRDGLYWSKSSLYIPNSGGEEGVIAHRRENLRNKIIVEHHKTLVTGHNGAAKTLELISRQYWWPGMREQVREFIAHCDSCQRVKAANHRVGGLLQPLQIPTHKWESISMDFITQLPKTPNGHDAILVVVDRLSKYAHFIATTTEVGAKEVAELFRDRIFALHGLPREVVSDRDPRFTGNFNQALFKLLGTRQAFSSAFHPESDGQTERLNRVLEDYLRHFIGPSMCDWDSLLATAEFSYNNSHHTSIDTTPFRLVYGDDPRLPFTTLVDTRVVSADAFALKMKENLEAAKLALQKAQARQKSYADTKRMDLSFNVGDKVLLNAKNIKLKSPGPRKLLPRYIGPFEIVAKIGEVAYRLKLPVNYKIHNVFHVSLLRNYKVDGTVQPPPPPELVDGDLEYEVEEIISHRVVRKRYEYLVKFIGYAHEHNLWLPERNMENCRAILQEYWARQDQRSGSRPAKRRKNN